MPNPVYLISFAWWSPAFYNFNEASITNVPNTQIIQVLWKHVLGFSPSAIKWYIFFPTKSRHICHQKRWKKIVLICLSTIPVYKVWGDLWSVCGGTRVVLWQCSSCTFTLTNSSAAVLIDLTTWQMPDTKAQQTRSDLPSLSCCTSSSPPPPLFLSSIPLEPLQSLPLFIFLFEPGMKPRWSI